MRLINAAAAITVGLAYALAPIEYVGHAQEEAHREYVRVTYYTLRGQMADTATTHAGAAACSNWMPLGTQLMFEDGFVVTCEDRGDGGRYWNGWIDVWAPSRAWGERYVSGDYGDYAWVEVVRWGWPEERVE